MVDLSAPRLQPWQPAAAHAGGMAGRVAVYSKCLRGRAHSAGGARWGSGHVDATASATRGPSILSLRVHEAGALDLP